MRTELYSFFSGIGFLDLGFQSAGFNIVFVNEVNKRYLSAYKYARRRDNSILKYGYSSEDVRYYLSDENWDRTFPNYKKANDCLIGFIGGPPCPDFSVAGKNEGSKGDNGQLTHVFVDLIIKREPDYFVFENVKGLYRTKKHKEFYDRMKNKLYRAGYSLFDSVENALEYGTPQNRDRLFLIGLRRKTFGKRLQYSFGGHRIFRLKDILSIQWPQTSPFIEGAFLEPPQDIMQELTVEYWFNKNAVYEHTNSGDFFNVKNVNRFMTIPEGDSGGKSFKRLHRWRYSPTAAYGNNEVHLHPYIARRISVAEALAIQSLPPSFEVLPNLPLSTKFKMVGNGVPYLLARGVALDLYHWLDSALKVRRK